jgi:hypothetical protein
MRLNLAIPISDAGCLLRLDCRADRLLAKIPVSGDRFFCQGERPGWIFPELYIGIFPPTITAKMNRTGPHQSDWKPLVASSAQVVVYFISRSARTPFEERGVPSRVCRSRPRSTSLEIRLHTGARHWNVGRALSEVLSMLSVVHCSQQRAPCARRPFCNSLPHPSASPAGTPRH